MNENIENVLATLDGFRMSDEMTYSAYSALHDEISLLDDLLKEHEAVKPIFIQTTRTHEGGLMEVSIKCGNCKSKVQCYPERWKYCPNCGRKVKWDGDI